MQEEVENKTVNLAVTTTKLGARTLYQALDAYVREQDRKEQDRQRTATEKKARDREKKSKEVKITGKQSVKQLIGQGQGVTSVDIADKGLRDFQRITNKYGVDFAVVRDKTQTPNRYTIFFKAKDADAMNSVVKEYTAKNMKRSAKKAKPSVLKKLKKYTEQVLSAPGKKKERKKVLDR